MSSGVISWIVFAVTCRYTQAVKVAARQGKPAPRNPCLLSLKQFSGLSKAQLKRFGITDAKDLRAVEEAVATLDSSNNVRCPRSSGTLPASSFCHFTSGHIAVW